MKIPVLVLGLATTAICSSIPMERQPLGQLEWSGALYKGGPVLSYSGEDLDDIDAQIKKDHPGMSLYGAPGSEDEDEMSMLVDDPEALVERELLARQERKLICNGYFGYGDGFANNDVWQGLHRAGGLCKAPGRTCVRIACHGTASAVFCNDGRNTVTLQCKHVGDHVRYIGQHCAEVYDCGLVKPKPCKVRVGGQRFSPGGTWNIIAARCPMRASWSWKN